MCIRDRNIDVSWSVEDIGDKWDYHFNVDSKTESPNDRQGMSSNNGEDQNPKVNQRNNEILDLIAFDCLKKNLIDVDDQNY